MKKFIIPILVWGVLTAGIIGWASITHAATGTSNNSNQGTNTNSSTNTTSQTLIDKLVAKFNLKKSDVQAVFDEYRQDRQKAHQDQIITNLDKAVQDGVITKDQENKLIQKQKDMVTQRQKERQDLQQWYKDNRIDKSKLSPYMGGFGHRGHYRNWANRTTQTTTTNK